MESQQNEEKKEDQIQAPVAQAAPAIVAPPAIITEAAQLIPGESSFASSKSFEHAQRVAKMLTASSLVPTAYQNNIPNTMIALEMSNRVGASPLMVMQNLHVIQGRPSWSSPFIIAALNSCGRFSPLRFQKSGAGDDYGFEAWANDIATGDRLEGPKVDWKMVKEEGWYAKPGSKWKTMPELMFRYRAAAFFGRLYAPDILMGMHTADEVNDFSTPMTREDKFEQVNDKKTRLRGKSKKATPLTLNMP